MTAEVIGLRHLPAGLSLTWLIMVPPTTFAEPIALELRHSRAKHWKYLAPELFTAFMYIGAAGCLWLVRGWKVGELEEIDKREAAAASSTVLEKSRPEELDRSAPPHPGPPEEVRIEASAAKAGWSDKRDLLRRMVAWKNV